jgi:hypothetical protein
MDREADRAIPRPPQLENRVGDEYLTTVAYQAATTAAKVLPSRGDARASGVVVALG